MKKMLSAAGLRLAYAYLDSDPEKKLPKLMNLADRFDRNNAMPSQRAAIREVIEKKDSNWYKLILSFWEDIDPKIRKMIFRNFFVNDSFLGWGIQEELRNKLGCNIPWAILMDPTSACNLHCTGCWAAEYGDKLSMSYETLDSIIAQGKKMGVYFYLFSGGEPLVRKNDIIKLCAKHNDCYFISFTNGTLIDEKFADDMLRVGNFAPAISVEGFEDATDARRGKGTYKDVVRAMEILKRNKLLFGISCCYTRQNTKDIGSDAFIDEMVEKGAKFAWFFTYIPVGADAVPELMVTAEQREFMYHRLRSFRKTKPIFTLDFWNDGQFVEGCIAGGRRYLHINAAGDIEPCAFIHYADMNIHQTTLLEAMQSPLFMQYHDHQPVNENMLRPCPLLDNPKVLQEIVDNAGTKSTDFTQPEDVHALCAKCVAASEKWAVVADRLWYGDDGGKKCPQSVKEDTEKPRRAV